MDFISLFFTKKISGLHCPDFNVCVECEVILVDRKVEKSVVMHDAIEHVFRLHMGDEKKEEEEGERKEWVYFCSQPNYLKKKKKKLQIIYMNYYILLVLHVPSN